MALGGRFFFVFQGASGLRVLNPCSWTGVSQPLPLGGSHRSTRIASDLASRALALEAKPQPESESHVFRIA